MSKETKPDFELLAKQAIWKGYGEPEGFHHNTDLEEEIIKLVLFARKHQQEIDAEIAENSYFESTHFGCKTQSFLNPKEIAKAIREQDVDTQEIK